MMTDKVGGGSNDPDVRQFDASHNIGIRDLVQAKNCRDFGGWVGEGKD
jgi:hypothetical protein